MDPRSPWLKEKAPGFHRFLTREDKPFPVIRETLVGALIVLVVLSSLWGFTGQPLGRSPIVVVESGSMMHCTNGFQAAGRDCNPTHYGRLGTIDPGDLILVKDIDGAGDVETRAEAGEHHYSNAGDVIVYRPDGSTMRTPIIHRALFWITIESDRTFSIAALGLSHVDHLAPRNSNHATWDDTDRALATLQAMCLCPGLDSHLRNAGLGPDDSGFITRGDNNPGADQGSGVANLPVQPEWILGKARGEIPWLGLVKLLFADFQGTSTNFAQAGGDSKMMLFVSLVVLLGGPYVFEKVRASRRSRREGEQPPT